MELVTIFEADNIEKGGIYSVRYNTGEKDEFERLFDEWADPEIVECFCNNHLEQLGIIPFGSNSLIKVAENIMDEAAELEEMLLELVESGATQEGHNLQQLFRPLDNRVYELTSLQASKASAKTRYRRYPLIRLYAIRLAPNLYIITGGAIKVTAKMADDKNLIEELNKINRVIQWLKDQDILFPEDLKKTDE
jgi:hypothetical protein